MSDLYLTDEIRTLLDMGAALVISVSGGKDSLAMTSALRRAFPSPETHLVFSDLGAAEWPQTRPFVESMGPRFNVPVHIVERHRTTPDGPQREDLVQHFERKQKDRPGQPHWATPSLRYCTSDHKRGPIDKLLRTFPLVVNAEGIRAQESDNRAKRHPLTLRAQITGSAFKKLSLHDAIAAWAAQDPTKKPARLALDWYPIFHWSEEEVWEEIGHPLDELNARRALYAQGRHEEALAGWSAHVCYVYGARRCSCVYCIMSSKNDLKVGLREMPELGARYIAMEQSSGYSFQQGRSLHEVAATIQDPADTPRALREAA